jgi:hypothetical protein
MDAHAPQDERRRRGRPSRVVPIPRRWGQVCDVMILQTTVANRPGHRGERGAVVNTIAQGRPMPWLTCSDVAHVLYHSYMRLWVRLTHPVFPAPSSFEGPNSHNDSGADSRRGIADACPGAI